MQFLYFLQQTFVWLLTIYWIYQLIISIYALIKFKDKPLITNIDHKFLAIIPAYNEEAVVGNLIESLKQQDYPKDKYEINPIFDIKHIWDKEEKYKEIDYKPIAYNEDGEVFYIVDINNYEKMKYLGYDKANNALRYTRETKGRKIYRIPLSTDYRIFVPVARDSKKFKKKYKMRTEVERLNGRLDRDYMFNDHFIRGQKKMELMVDLSFLVMLTMAKGHIKNKQKNIRSLFA